MPPRKSTTTQIKITKSRDVTLFPWRTFLWRLDNLDEKRICWFQCEEHATKYINRHNPKYKLLHYVGVKYKDD
jgi:hypothetical protein